MLIAIYCYRNNLQLKWKLFLTNLFFQLNAMKSLITFLHRISIFILFASISLREEGTSGFVLFINLHDTMETPQTFLIFLPVLLFYQSRFLWAVSRASFSQILTPQRDQRFFHHREEHSSSTRIRYFCAATLARCLHGIQLVNIPKDSGWRRESEPILAPNEGHSRNGTNKWPPSARNA